MGCDITSMRSNKFKTSLTIVSYDAQKKVGNVIETANTDVSPLG